MWQKVLSQMWRLLAGSLGLTQVAIFHWIWTVLLGRVSPSTPALLLASAAFAALHVVTLPMLRRARMRGGASRSATQVYMGVSVATLIVGLAVALAWLVLAPLVWGLAWGMGVEALPLFRVVSSVFVLAVIGMVVWAFTGGVSGYQVSRVRIPVPGLAPARAGLRILQLSDLHIGNGMEGPRLDDLVARANALEPDLIALTGDLFDFDPRFLAEGARGLGGLRAPLGVFAVTGNHDEYTGRDAVIEALGGVGIRFLSGDIERLPGEGPLYLAGVDDPGREWTARDVHLPQLDHAASRRAEDGPTLLLVHRPEAFRQAVSLGFPVVFCGHTHGGQLALPGPRGRVNLAHFISRYPRGLYREGDSLLYVNRGAGVAGPAVRFNCSRELALFELVPSGGGSTSE